MHIVQSRAERSDYKGRERLPFPSMVHLGEGSQDPNDKPWNLLTHSPWAGFKR